MRRWRVPLYAIVALPNTAHLSVGAFASGAEVHSEAA